MIKGFFLVFRAFLTKTAFRLAMLCAFFAFIGVFVYALKIEESNVPPKDLVVPFGKGSGKAIVAGASQTTGGITLQHMSSAEVAERLEEIIAEALSFNKSNYTYGTASVEKYFTPEGYAQYKQFLASALFEQTITSQNLQSGAYVEQAPLELNKGVFGNAYKWVFEVPVTISFIPRNSETYRNDETKALNRRILLRAQFTRVQDPKDPNAVKIEIWQVLPARKQ